MIDVSQLAVTIQTQRNGEAVLIRPHLQSPTPLTLQYSMTISQNSHAGTSSISQSGELQSDTPAGLVQLSMPSGARCMVHLEVFQYDRLIKAVDSTCE